ncbi:Ldh family oxidoreductase [Treponema primitia]|uniref:Ldh family oxidoreductase n=1 Tax=Treponema primitia TaxID=88058 RepID=UPI00025555D3|nr:Ldh family oxidoreductase [Treponema primitia]
MAEYTEIPYPRLWDFCSRLFPSYGFSAEEGKTITEILLRADLFGIESHGIHRLVRYDEEIKTGMVTVRAKPEIIHETPVSAVMDGHKAMGQLTAVRAMDLAIEKASHSGIGMVTVRNSNHYGIAGYYTGLALEADFIGITMTNTEAICVPTNGKRAMLGTNPIAFAMPADPLPFSFDASTTMVTRGTMEVYQKSGKPVPDNWAVDTKGHPTTDAGEVVRNIIGKFGGGIAPLGGSSEIGGGHKGYGLATMVDICCGILSGGLTSNHINIKPGETGICHYFAAIDYGIFGNKQEQKRALSVFLEELRSSPRVDGKDRIYTHGEKARETMAARINGVIPVNQKTLGEMRTIASRQGVVWDIAP